MSVQTKLEQHLPAFLNTADPVVSTLLQTFADVLEGTESVQAAANQTLRILPSTGPQLDYFASLFGITRYVGETDASLLIRMATVFFSAVTPNGLESSALAQINDLTIYEPAGGSFRLWDPRVDFRFGRTYLTPTYTSPSITLTTLKDGTSTTTTTAADTPMFEAVNEMFYIALFGPYMNPYTNSSYDQYEPAFLNLYMQYAATVPSAQQLSFSSASTVIGTQQQGTFFVGVDVGQGAFFSSTTPYYLLDAADIGLYLYYENGVFVCACGGDSSSFPAPTFQSSQLHSVALTWDNTTFTLYLDQQILGQGTASVTDAPSGIVYVGGDSTGSYPINAYIGNILFAEAAFPPFQVLTWEAGVAIPVYAQTLYSGAWFTNNTALTGIVGGMVDGVSNYVGIYTESDQYSSAFVLGSSFLSTETDSFLSPPNEQNQLFNKQYTFPLFAAGKKLFLYQPGSPT